MLIHFTNWAWSKGGKWERDVGKLEVFAEFLSERLTFNCVCVYVIYVCTCVRACVCECRLEAVGPWSWVTFLV